MNLPLSIPMPVEKAPACRELACPEARVVLAVRRRPGTSGGMRRGERFSRRSRWLLFWAAAGALGSAFRWIAQVRTAAAWR